MTNKNIVFFSSGVTERNGILGAMVSSLTAAGFHCSYWRDLFSGAKDSDNIALLPILIKKIPTFDYAVLICEGHDTTTIERNGYTELVSTMRDNVLFEIGLCVMALGLPRTVLVTDDTVRMPDDLSGIGGQLALKRVFYKKGSDAAYASAAGDVAAYLDGVERASSEVSDYIRETGDTLTPVIIGASSATACGYVNNFIFRTLEHIEDGIEYAGGILPVDISKVFVHIGIPEEYDENVAALINERRRRLCSGTVSGARGRPAVFGFERINDEIHITDYPTTVSTSYDTAKMILGMDADDTDDEEATVRFTHKELNLFEATLRAMLNRDFLAQLLAENYPGLDERELTRIRDNVTDVMENRLDILRVTV